MDDGWIPFPMLLLLFAPLVWWIAWPSIVVICGRKRIRNKTRAWSVSVCTAALVTAACGTAFLMSMPTSTTGACFRAFGLPLICVIAVTALTLCIVRREQGSEDKRSQSARRD